jgi:hypothetical protein
MDFTVDQLFDAPLLDVLDLYADPGFFTSLPATERLATPELVSVERDGTTVVLALRHRLTAELPAMVTKFVDPTKLTWVETTTLDLTGGRSNSALVPDEYPDLLKASAAATFTHEGGRTRRVVTGRVEVPVPLFGGKVEGAIVDGLTAHLDGEVAEARRRLAPD